MQKLKGKCVIKFAEGVAAKVKYLAQDDEMEVFDLLSADFQAYL
jgi:hypothetical protein